MQTKKAECKQINARSDRFTHRIGSMTYTVSIYPNEGRSEKLEDKILRLINSELESGAGGAENHAGNANSLLKGGSANDKMFLPQANSHLAKQVLRGLRGLPERGSA